MMNCQEAIKSALAGNEAGFEYLYNQTKNQKYYLALKYVGDEETAKDVLQEAYVKAWKNLASVDPEKFESWFGTIVANTAKNELAKRKRTALDLREEIDEEIEPNEVFDRTVSSWENMPELNYTRKETAELVHELLDELPEEQRMVLLMFEIEELTIREIAEALECSEATVKSRLKYGRNKIKVKGEELQKKGYKLYSFSPIVLLILLLKTDEKVFAAEATTSAALDFCKKNVWNSQKMAKAAAVKSTGIKTFLATTVGKATVGVASAFVIGGVAIGTIAYSNNNNPPKEGQNVAVLENTEEHDKEIEKVQTEEKEIPTENEEIIYENEDGSDPFFDYEKRFELGDPDSFGVSGSLNIVDINHIKKYTGEKIEKIDEDWQINSVGSTMIGMLIYKERQSRKHDVTWSGNEYFLSPVNYSEVPNGETVHVESSITVGAEHIWGTPAVGCTVTIYKVSSEEHGDGYLLQNAFDGMPGDVNPVKE